MATSLGEGLSGFAGHLERTQAIAEYVIVASLVSAIVGGYVLPRLLHPGGQGPTCPPCDCPPCQCFCGCFAAPKAA